LRSLPRASQGRGGSSLRAAPTATPRRLQSHAAPDSVTATPANDEISHPARGEDQSAWDELMPALRRQTEGEEETR